LPTPTSSGKPSRPSCGAAAGADRLRRVRRRGLVAALAVWGLLEGYGRAGLPPLLLLNPSPSLPLGLYAYAGPVPAARGDVVMWAHPPGYAYLGGRVLKRVTGVAGDAYCWDPELRTQRLNGTPMPPPLPAAVEAGLRPWTGCQRLAPGQVVGYGDSPGSWDSRFFGVVAESDLAGVYVHVW
jgi:type IV secretory pathway protease TraF